jgi:formyl-CoA transferase
LIGAPELAERFPQLLYDQALKDELFPLVGKAVSARPTAEWCQVFRDAGIRHAPVRDYAEVVADPDVWANGYFAEVDGVRVVCSPVYFSDTPARPATAAPELGQHTEEVLLQAGFGWEDLGRLAEEGVI